MSTAVDGFNPGFSPESSSMAMLITGRSSGLFPWFNTFPFLFKNSGTKNEPGE